MYNNSYTHLNAKNPKANIISQDINYEQDKSTNELWIDIQVIAKEIHILMKDCPNQNNKGLINKINELINSLDYICSLQQVTLPYNIKADIPSKLLYQLGTLTKKKLLNKELHSKITDVIIPRLLNYYQKMMHKDHYLIIGNYCNLILGLKLLTSLKLKSTYDFDFHLFLEQVEKKLSSHTDKDKTQKDIETIIDSIGVLAQGRCLPSNEPFEMNKLINMYLENEFTNLDKKQMENTGETVYKLGILAERKLLKSNIDITIIIHAILTKNFMHISF